MCDPSSRGSGQWFFPTTGSESSIKVLRPARWCFRYYVITVSARDLRSHRTSQLHPLTRSVRGGRISPEGISMSPVGVVELPAVREGKWLPQHWHGASSQS